MKHNTVKKILVSICDINAITTSGLVSDEYAEIPFNLNKQEKLEVKIIQPYFSEIEQTNYKIEKIASDFEIFLGDKVYKGEFYKTKHQGIEIIFVKNCELFCDYSDRIRRNKSDFRNVLPLSFFNHAVMQYLLTEDFKPDILHCFGWETGLIPLLKKEIFAANRLIKKIKTSFSVFNFYSQGVYDHDLFRYTGLPGSYFSTDKLEFWGGVSFIKSGLIYSDKIIILGATEDDDFFVDEKSFGLGGVLYSQRKKIKTVPLGVDYNTWNPNKDNFIKYKYDFSNIEQKRKNKKALLKGSHLQDCDLPLIAIFGYLTPFTKNVHFEKLFDVILDLNVNVLVVGETNRKIFEVLKYFNTKFLKRFLCVNSYDEFFIHKMLAGADILFLPTYNKFYPFIHLNALKYGTVSVLSDFYANSYGIKDYYRDRKDGNGFIAYNNNIHSLLAKLLRAVNFISCKKDFHCLADNMMKEKLLNTETYKKLTDIFISMT